MFCTQCGVKLETTDRFCFSCGASTGRPADQPSRPLMRSLVNKRIAGVCGGLGIYMGVDPTVVRLLVLVLLFGLPPAGLLGYIAAWIIIPMEPYPVYQAAPATPPVA